MEKRYGPQMDIEQAIEAHKVVRLRSCYRIMNQARGRLDLSKDEQLRQYTGYVANFMACFEECDNYAGDEGDLRVQVEALRFGYNNLAQYGIT